MLIFLPTIDIIVDYCKWTHWHILRQYCLDGLKVEKHVHLLKTSIQLQATNPMKLWGNSDDKLLILLVIQFKRADYNLNKLLTFIIRCLVELQPSLKHPLVTLSKAWVSMNTSDLNPIFAVQWHLRSDEMQFLFHLPLTEKQDPFVWVPDFTQPVVC